MKSPGKPIWASIVETIRSSRKTVITSHRSPDGDAIGSMVAVNEIIRDFGREALLYLPDPVPGQFEFIDVDGSIRVYGGEKDRAAILGTDLWICVDFNDPSRMGAMGELVGEYKGDIVCIDHHRGTKPFGQIVVADETASATGLLIAEWVDWQGGPWTEALVTACYSALANDTGNFRHANTDVRTLKMAARLVEKGAVPFDICRYMYGCWPEGRIRLLTRALESLRIEPEIKTAFLVVRQADFEATGTGTADLEEFVNYARILDKIEVGILICELSAEKCKASLRSNGVVNVEEIARSLGGGGHRNASGVRLGQSVDQALETLREGLKKRLVKDL